MPNPVDNRIKILVAEDNVALRESLVKHLEYSGFSVTAANDGLAAYDEFRREYFDVVVSDYEMPRADGLMLYHSIRDREGYLTTLFILHTAAEKTIGFDDAIANDEYFKLITKSMTSAFKIKREIDMRAANREEDE
jgi:CheY-like chemotaxis protein